LGEVEAAACTMWDEPVEVTALVVEDELVLFVAAEAMRGERRLRTHVARTLPKYMVPSRVVAVESFPRLVSGKIDMGALRRGEYEGDEIESAFSAQPSTHMLIHAQLRADGQLHVYAIPVAGALLALVADHVVLGRVVFPATGYLNLAHAATTRSVKDAQTDLRDVFFLQPLYAETDGLVVEVAIGAKRFEISSTEGGEAAVHCSGTLSAGQHDIQPADYPAIRSRAAACAAHVTRMYEIFDASGLQYGPDYRTLEKVYCSTADTGMAAARLRARSMQQGIDVHPANLDDALCLDQLISIGAAAGETRLPFAVDDVRLRAAPGEELWAVRAFSPRTHCTHACAHARVRRSAMFSQAVIRQGAEAMGVRLGAAGGKQQAQLGGFTTRVLRAMVGPPAASKLLYHVKWSAVNDNVCTLSILVLIEQSHVPLQSGPPVRQLPKPSPERLRTPLLCTPHCCVPLLCRWQFWTAVLVLSCPSRARVTNETLSARRSWRWRFANRLAAWQHS
jgi:hypothetical protein